MEGRFDQQNVLERSRLLPVSPLMPHSQRRRSESINSASISPLSTTEDVHSQGNGMSNVHVTPIEAGKKSVPHTHAAWLPYTLRWYFISLLAAVSLALGLAILMLYRHSERHQGLGPEEDAIFGWKFIPTLIAVIYTQLTVMLFDDAKRTEPFARLAGTTIPSASRGILERPRQWWVSLAHGFKKRKNGGKIGWVLILTCIVNVFAFLIISPLSAVLLGIDLVNLSQNWGMTRMSPPNSQLAAVAERDTYFRTTGALFQNVTMSPWISDDFFVLPFWPTGMNGPLWNHRDANSQTWKAETLVFRTDLQCSKLELAKIDSWSRPEPENMTEYANKTGMREYEFASVILKADDGCQYNITTGKTKGPMSTNYSSWADIGHVAEEREYADWILEPLPPTYNDKCRGDEVIMFGTPWVEFLNGTSKLLSNISTTGYLCYANHTMATLPVSVSVSQANLAIEFDKQEFFRSSQAVPESLFNLSQLHDLYLTPDWYSYIPFAREFGGASALLATQFDFDFDNMRHNNTIPEKAAQIRRRFFGEIMRTSFSAPQAANMEPVEGSRATFERRVTVNMETAYVVSALLFASFAMLVLVVFLSRTSQRGLNLAYDPSTVLGIASLAASDQSILLSLQQLDQASKGVLKAALKERLYYTSPGALHEYQKEGEPLLHSTEPKDMNVKARDERPSWLTLRKLSGLAVYLAALIVAIAVLYNYANKASLHQALFTYRVNVEIRRRSVAFAPFSIIPTVLAIGVGLWWSGVDKSMRALQPFVSISKKPVPISRGAGASYQSSYWLWATFKSARNKDWLLMFVTLGSFLAQVFIITMAALFEQGTGILDYPINLPRTLELRQTPHLTQETWNYPPELDNQGRFWGVGYVQSSLVGLYSNLSTNWMYSAMLSASFNESDPAWSSEGWSFVPLNISDMPTVKEIYQRNNQSIDSDSSDYVSTVNVTVRTPAIRGTIECSPIEEVSNSSRMFLDRFNLTTEENRLLTRNFSHVYKPSPNMFDNTNLSTPFTVASTYVACCYNQTDPSQIQNHSMPVAIGSWTQNYLYASPNNPAPANWSITGTTGNFTVKWVHGNAGFTFFGETYGPAALETVPSLFFPELPKVQAINCMPVVETTQAEVVVDSTTGRVQAYTILEDPKPDPGAWSDAFMIRKATDPSSIVMDPDPSANTYVTQNITSSYGTLFYHSLLRASSLSSLDNVYAGATRVNLEPVSDKAFNIRNNETGLNLDFMSYASYLSSGQDPSALLDYNTLLSHTKKTYELFFQHYVSSSVNLQTGGWAYQPIGDKLVDVGDPAFEAKDLHLFMPDGSPVVQLSQLPAQNTPRDADATLSARVEILRMNPVAFLVAVGILVWLMVTISVVAGLQRWYLAGMVRNVESVADVLVLVAGSPVLLGLVREYGVERLLKEDVCTELGWFRDADGRMRWGVEVVDRGLVRKG